MICLARSARALPVLYLHSSVYHICPRKIFISVKGLHRVSWESRLALMQMTAAVSFTLCTVDRRASSKDLSGSTAELTARAAHAINISGNNNHGCLFFPKLSVSMTDLFWRCLLFWQISGLTVTSPCLCVVCMLTWCLPPVSGWCRQAGSARGIQLKQQWHRKSMYFGGLYLKCLIFHKSANLHVHVKTDIKIKFQNEWDGFNGFNKQKKVAEGWSIQKAV